MSSNILAIVPDDFDLGFMLTGIDTKGCASDKEARECLEKEMLEHRYDIAIVDEKFILSFDSRFNKKIQESETPLVMAIPLKRGVKEEVETKNYFLKMVQNAIGYEIRIK